MKTDFTPGPWKQTGTNVRTKDGGLVCTAANHWADTTTPLVEKEANARLIAYAPVLLEALEMAWQFLEIVEHSQKDKDLDLSKAATLLSVGFECVMSQATGTNENLSNN